MRKVTQFEYKTLNQTPNISCRKKKEPRTALGQEKRKRRWYTWEHWRSANLHQSPVFSRPPLPHQHQYYTWGNRTTQKKKLEFTMSIQQRWAFELNLLRTIRRHMARPLLTSHSKIPIDFHDQRIQIKQENLRTHLKQLAMGYDQWQPSYNYGKKSSRTDHSSSPGMACHLTAQFQSMSTLQDDVSCLALIVTPLSGPRQRVTPAGGHPWSPVGRNPILRGTMQSSTY